MTLAHYIEFPALDWHLPISDTLVQFELFGNTFTLKWYGVMIALGFLLAVIYGLRRAPQFGINPDKLIDVALVCTVAGFIGARLYYVFFSSNVEEYLQNPRSILYIWEGGIGIYGGIIAAFLTGLLMCRICKVDTLAAFDIASLGFLIGQGVGRWGNFFNQEAFGGNTTLPWGMTGDIIRAGVNGIDYDTDLPVHPTFLYESIWCFVGLALLVAYIKKRKFNGDIALRYLVWYGAGRFWIESLRTDSLLLVPSLGLRASQLVAAAAVVGGVALEIFLTRKYKSKPLMVTLALTAENRSLLAKVRKAEPEFTVEREELVASSPRKLFLERTNAYNERVKQQLKEKLAEKN